MRRRKIKTTFHSLTFETGIEYNQYERQPQSLQARQTNTRELPPMLFSEREPSPSKYKYKRFGDETVNLYNCRSLSDCSFVHVTQAQLLFSSTELNNEASTSLACGKERGLKRARPKNAFDSRENQCGILKTKTFFFYSRHILSLKVSRDKNNF